MKAGTEIQASEFEPASPGDIVTRKLLVSESLPHRVENCLQCSSDAVSYRRKYGMAENSDETNESKISSAATLSGL